MHSISVQLTVHDAMCRKSTETYKYLSHSPMFGLDARSRIPEEILPTLPLPVPIFCNVSHFGDRSVST